MPHLSHWTTTTPEAPWCERGAVDRCADDGPLDLAIGAPGSIAWRGFGACFNELGWQALGHLGADERSLTLDRLFAPDGELRFDFCRLPIGANDYSLDWHSLAEKPGDLDLHSFSIDRDRQQLIPFIKEGLTRNPDLRLFASPWSPPAWMKTPPVYNFGRFSEDPAVRDCYARYFLRFVEAYEAEGIAIEQVHLQNEPVSSQKFPSCIMTGEEMRDLIGQHLGPIFAAAGRDTEIWLGTINGPETDSRKYTSGFNDYAFCVLNDPDAARYTSGVSYQWAGKYALQQTRLAYPDLRMLQSENECGDGANTWRYAEYVWGLFHHYLINDVEAYVYWNMILERGGESTWGWRQNSLFTVDPATGHLTTNPEYHIMRHFCQDIRPGMRRCPCSRPWAGNAVAFANATRHVVVFRNPFAHSVTLRLGLNGQRWRLECPGTSFHTVILDND